MRLNAKAPSAESDRRRGGEPSRGPRARRACHATTLLAAAAFALLLLVASAQAAGVTYSAGTALPAPGKTTSVAVDQSSGQVYVSNASVSGSFTLNGPAGTVRRFDSSGAPLTCALSPLPVHPAGLGVDPTTGNLYSVDLGANAAATRLRTYAAGCGAEVASNTGTANTAASSAELTSVAMAHPLQVGQWVTGTGIPNGADATGKFVASSKQVTEISGVSGTFAVGQTLFPTALTILSCTPNCSAPTEIELSAAAGMTGEGVPIHARTTVVSVNEGAGTAELSNAAEATAAGVAISASAWKVEATTAAPLGQPGIDASGNILFPNRNLSKLQKLAPWGQERVEGGFPVSTGMKRTSSAALDAKGDVFVVSTGEEGTFTCADPSKGQLLKLNPDGTSPAVFAGLTEYATTVAVDKKTGNVYVGRGCQAMAGHEFEIEVRGPGGGLLASEIGKGAFATVPGSAGFGGPSLFNQLALDEASGKLYAVDAGHEVVQVFTDTSAQKTLSTSVSGDNPGVVQCNGTGNPCLESPETYDEGQEIIAEAIGGTGFVEWEGTGSAASCTGTATTTCTFTLSSNSTIKAKYSIGPVPYPLTKTTSGTGSGTFTCKVLPSGSEEPCQPSYEEGKEVEVLAQPGTGSHFVEFNGENGGECTGATCIVTMSAAKTVNAKFDLDSETFSETVTGPGSLECEDATAGGGFGACASSYPYGHTIKAKAVPNAGAHLQSLSGSGSAAGTCSGNECSFVIHEPSGASATFALDEETLSVLEPGGGSGEVKCNGGSCAGPWHYGDTIEVTATPTGGSTLGPISGSGSASSCSGSPCSFAITEASTVSVNFQAPGSATLHVFKGGGGQGTVTSTPAGISCGTEPCEHVFPKGEEVELQAAAGTGSVFAGWIGCQPLSGEVEKCKVTVSGTTDVTAVFLTEGTPGQGVTVTTEPPGGNCTNGGVKVVAESGTSYVCNGAPGATGSPGQGVTGTDEPAGAKCINGGAKVVSAAGTTYVCNGAAGTPGQGVTVSAESPGANCAFGGVRLVSVSGISFICNGAPGASGPTGPQGPSGGQGAKGDAGAPGAPGATGAQGPQGERGPAGKVKVICKVKQKGQKVKVSCEVKQPKGQGSARAARAIWSVHRAGHRVKHGRTSARRLQRVLNHLPAGRYVLRIADRHRPIAIVVGR